VTQKYLLNKDSCQTKLVFLCPILQVELKLIGLDSVDVLLVDVETCNWVGKKQEKIMKKIGIYSDSEIM
jgi:hypothetical protein